ncbi:MAG: hypothetical protein V7644_2104 [Actinomycetota bacterium]
MASRPLRTAGYCRVSTAEQAEHGFSLGEQERLLREDADLRGETWTSTYVDAGLSGRKRENRPELNAMLAAAGAGKFDVLVIPSLDRLGRNARDVLEILTRVEIAGVAVRSLRGDLDTTTATGKLMTGVMASLAEFESNVIGERTRMGKRAAARKGRPNGGPRPFGFDRKDGTLIPRPTEIAVVQRVVREYVGGATQTQIAVGLNRDGLKTARGKAWNQPQVSQLIRDPVWVGFLRSKDGDFAAAHGEVITRELWEQAQAIGRSSGRKEGGRPTKAFLLGNGLLKCGRCGSSMRVRRERKDYGWYEVYMCYGRDSGQTECDQPATSRKLVDENVLGYFTSVSLDVEAMIAEFQSGRDRQLADVRARRDNARNVERKAEERLARLDALLADGALEPDEWRRTTEPHRRDFEAARAALSDLAAEDAAVRSEAIAADAEAQVLHALAQVRAAVAGDIAASADIEATQAAIRRVFRHFVLRDGDPPTLEPVPHMLLDDLPGSPITHRVEGGAVVADFHFEDGDIASADPVPFPKTPISFPRAETTAWPR